MYGNNIQATGFERVNILMQDANTATSTTIIPGKRYFFPENPVLEKKTIVGIEAHGRQLAPTSLSGDLNDLSNLNGASNQISSQFQYFYLTIYDKKGFLKFDNLPLNSLLIDKGGLTIGLIKRIKPYYGSIDFSKSFIYIPANLVVSLPISYIPLTFYYQ